jgi:orotate phosphoribosyltransferase
MSPDATDRQRLADLLRSRSLRTGEFILSSGARSSYYIDARLTTMSGAGQMLIGRVGIELLDQSGWHPQAVGGLTLGADPVAYAIAHAATLSGRTLDAFTVRKEAKDHGAGRTIEGPLEDGADVVIVEDVVTTGESALRAHRALSASGAHVLGVLALVDREEGGREKIEDEGLRLIPFFTRTELLAGRG